jgi:uncharacterized membrane protein YfcA
VDFSHWVGLTATTFVAALLYSLSGFGFAILAAPLFLLFVDPAQAIQLVIIVSTALSLVVIPGLRRAIAPRLLLRLALGSLAGLPLGLVAFRFADPILVRAAAGAVIFGFACFGGLAGRPIGDRLGAESFALLAIALLAAAGAYTLGAAGVAFASP